MSTRTVRINFWYNDVLTNATSAVLADKTATFGVRRDDTDATVVAVDTAMTLVSGTTGQYEHSFTEPVGYTGSYTAWVKFVYGGNTYYEEVDLPATTTSASLGLACNYTSLVNDVGYHLFGLRPTSTDVISDGVASTNQATDILRAITKGLWWVYAAHRWSFLRPLVPITTYADYATGTIAVTAGGTVTGTNTVFPSYSASANGYVSIPSVGAFAVATYVSGTSLTLANYDGGAVSSSTYTLYFNRYPMPAGVDSLEGHLTYPQEHNWPRVHLERRTEVEIRRLLARCATTGRPEIYALTMETFDPTAGSERYITLYPPPDDEYLLTAVGTLRPPMIDAVNQYPLGIEVLAPVITEACLAAAEREIEQKDALHPDAVHNRAVGPLLAMAIRRDNEYSTAETLGVDYGQEGNPSRGLPEPVPLRRGSIYWNAGGGADVGYI